MSLAEDSIGVPSVSVPFPSISEFLPSVSAPIAEASFSTPSVSAPFASVSFSSPSVSAPFASASGSFSIPTSGSGCCCGGGGGGSGSASGSCDPDTHTCGGDECKVDGCCLCVPSSAPFTVSLTTCCGTFSGDVTMTNGGSGCAYSGTFSMCGQTLTITADPNACTVTIGGGCFPTKNGSVTCGCNGMSFTVEWTAAELAGCPGC